MNDERLALALDRIESREARLLAWGITDRGLTEEDLEELLSPVADGDVKALLSELKNHGLIFEVPRSYPAIYRSRMAEGVRLFSQLRQWFPGHPWGDAAPLVADYRFLVQPRLFPKRSLGLEDVQQRLHPLVSNSTSRAALTGLLGDKSNGNQRLLSKFQLDATEEVLRGLAANGDQGCIVTAGTGSGKTLAFYLPTLLNLVQDPDLGKGTRVLAVYPRIELLKDQLLATLRETRLLASTTPEAPKIRIGAYFGPTPGNNTSYTLRERSSWKRIASLEGFVCPYLTCPGVPGGEDCGGPLAWRDDDRDAARDAARERLVCGICGTEISSEEFAISRESMQSHPPDILFTTTEMLNLSLPDDWSRHVFGVGPKAKVKPRTVLIDEAHIYSGSTGAQTAYVLRRWRNLVGAPVMWVGLSATLREAETFFGSLTGVKPDFVREVAPQIEDMERRGHEYQLLLRGDPTSQTALLSTSIQALMLLLRLQDPLGTSVSGGLYGNKVFAFCDNLDILNRLYRNLLDAEGRNPVGRIDSDSRGSLSLLRSQLHNPQEPDWANADVNGQNWWIADRLRPDPTPPLIGRTSSQDPGVQAKNEVVVATASLEVGFDDPTVGAVFQHKAPREVSQFVQRRGRAGRKQEMRPWTVVVLSDYGRDRLAYQSYEQLFDPTLPPKSLPLGNRSIQRMQATFAVMDWATKNKFSPTWKGSVRKDLSKPAEKEKDRQRQRALARVLEEVLVDEAKQEELDRYLQRALRLSAEETQLLLWEGPRSVLLEAIPTALRRLQSAWRIVRDGEVVEGGDRNRQHHPIPDFLPANLFSDLCLPEVEVIPPEEYDEGKEEPIFLVLNQFAPGNVTLRYAVQKTRGLWIQVPAGNQVDVTDSLLPDADVIAQVSTSGGGQVDVFRPFAVRPTVAGPAVAPTSSGRFNWEVRIRPNGGGTDADMPEATNWKRFDTKASFFVHAGTGGVSVLRYALGGEAQISENRETRRVFYELVNGHEPVAIGVELDVDAFRVLIKPPSTVEGFELNSDERRLRQLRRDRFAYIVRDQLGGVQQTGPFLAGWLAELSLAAIAHQAINTNDSDTLLENWSETDWKENLTEAFDRSFQGLHADNGETGDGNGKTGDRSPLRDNVREAAQNPEVTTVLKDAYRSAQTGPDPQWHPWLKERFAATTAAALHTAIQNLLPEFDAENDLDVDIIEADGGEVEIWLTETTVGGGGIIEMLQQTYQDDPRRFWSLAEGALEASDLEQAAVSLRRVVVGLCDGPLTEPGSTYRAASGNTDSLESWRGLLASIAQLGIPPSHALSAAMTTRIFPEGSSPKSDNAIRMALNQWDSWEEELDFTLDQRTACGLLAGNEDVVEALREAAPVNVSNSDSNWAFNVLIGLLWAPAEFLRPHSLQTRMRFVPTPAQTERTLVRDALETQRQKISVAQGQWRTLADAQLASQGLCVLTAATDNEPALRDALHDLMADPVEMGWLYLHPRLTGIRRHLEGVDALLELVEAPQ